MAVINFTPSYRGVWISPHNVNGNGIFSIWMRGDGSGKFWEEYQEHMFEGEISSLIVREDAEISFCKKYKNPKGGLLNGGILYHGKKSERWKLTEGVWREEGMPEDGSQRFYLASDKSELQDLEIILGELRLINFDRKLIDIQKESSFLSIIE